MKTATFMAVIALLFGTTAFAGIVTYSAVLAGSNESPPTGSPGTGFATVTVDSVLNTMLVDLTFSGLEFPNSAAHIHCCIAQGGNTGVATSVPTFLGFPTGVTAGTYTHLFDLTDPVSWNPAFIAANGGTAAGAEAALLAGLAANQTYLNIHSVNPNPPPPGFPNGEIRGFLAVAAPEPGTFLLAGALLAGLLIRRRAV